MQILCDFLNILNPMNLTFTFIQSFNPLNTKDLDTFFSSIGDTKSSAVNHNSTMSKKNTTRRSLDNLSSLSASSKRNSMSICVEEFPMSLLKDNSERINQLMKSILEQMQRINSIETEKASFQRMIDELEESVNKWSEKTGMLTDKAKDQPVYDNVDQFLDQNPKELLEKAELMVMSLKAKKCLETVLGECLPNPEATAENMSNIRKLVAEFIQDDKTNF